jgi:hypothetical protein
MTGCLGRYNLVLSDLAVTSSEDKYKIPFCAVAVAKKLFLEE